VVVWQRNWACHRFLFSVPILILPSVYGNENISSGASSDIRKATRTAQAMVKVSIVTNDFSTFLCLFLAMGLLKVGPNILWRSRHVPQSKEKGANRRRGHKVGSLFCDNHSLISFLFICRLVRGGEARAFTLLSSKIEDLHRVRDPSLTYPVAAWHEIFPKSLLVP